MGDPWALRTAIKDAYFEGHTDGMSCGQQWAGPGCQHDADAEAEYLTPTGHILVERAELDRLRAVEAAARKVQPILDTMERQLDGHGHGDVFVTAETWADAVRPFVARLRTALTRKQP